MRRQALGLPSSEHRKQVQHRARLVREALREARAAIKAGACPSAFADLSAAYFDMGAMYTHLRSADPDVTLERNYNRAANATDQLRRTYLAKCSLR